MKKVSLPTPVSKELNPYILWDLYVDQHKSVAEIADYFNCSQNKINYWIEKCEIPKRTISEAMSIWHKIRN